MFNIIEKKKSAVLLHLDEKSVVGKTFTNQKLEAHIHIIIASLVALTSP